MINLVKKGGGNLPTKTQTVIASVSSGASSVKQQPVNFDALDRVNGLVALDVASASTTSVALIRMEYSYFNNLMVSAGRPSNASTSSNWTITAYQGDVSESKVESQDVTLNGSTVTVTFTHNIKCIKRILDGDRQSRRITGIAINGNTLTLRCVGSTNHTQTIEIYY